MSTVAQSLSQFWTNPVRTALTLLGMVFGVASVVAMVSIGEGARRGILEAIDAMGADSAHVLAEPVEKEEISNVIGHSVGLHRGEVRAISDVVPGVRKIAYRGKHAARVTDMPVSAHDIRVYTVSEDLFELHGLSVADGRKLLPFDHDERRRVAVIGDELAKVAFAGDAVGKHIRLDYAYFEVVGVLASHETSGIELPVAPELYNKSVLVPFATAEIELASPATYGELDMISVQMQDMKQTVEAKAVLTPLLASLHGGETDFSVIAPEEILRQKEETQDILNLVLLCIAAISLLVGGIGVMNIMLANIMERIHEIGLRRALGARKRDIRNQFLLEAVLICFIGGTLGIIVGLIISVAVAFSADLPIAFAWESMLASFVISAGVGVLFGIVPAMRAAAVSPMEALRG